MGMTNLKSNVAELAIAAECAKKNWVVCFPYGENTPYDLIIDTGTKLLRIQIKYATSKNNAIDIPLRSTTGVKYKETVDVIAAYCPCNDKVYWFDLTSDNCDSVDTYIRLRLAESKNNQKTGVRFGEEYEFAGVA